MFLEAALLDWISKIFNSANFSVWNRYYIVDFFCLKLLQLLLDPFCLSTGSGLQNFKIPSRILSHWKTCLYFRNELCFFQQLISVTNQFSPMRFFKTIA